MSTAPPSTQWKEKRRVFFPKSCVRPQSELDKPLPILWWQSILLFGGDTQTPHYHFRDIKLHILFKWVLWKLLCYYSSLWLFTEVHQEARECKWVAGIGKREGGPVQDLLPESLFSRQLISPSTGPPSLAHNSPQSHKESSAFSHHYCWISQSSLSPPTNTHARMHPSHPNPLPPPWIRALAHRYIKH